MIQPLRFEPLYRERVWGGRGLESKLGRTLPADAPIGESWDVVDRPEAQSVVTSGEFRGLTLREVLRRNSDEVMGPGYDPGRAFPILVKWLDCRERLSLQVHPPATVASELDGEPKTENWYIADAEPGAALIAGLKAGVTRERFEAALGEEALEEFVHRFEVGRGDSIFVPSGRIHAIDGGNLILEIQQNSDTTYRVYDWGRVGLDGKKRTLHIEESLACIDFNDIEPEPVRASGEDCILADCVEFRIRKMHLGPGKADLVFPAGQTASLVHVAEGEVESRDGETALRRGDTVLLPRASEHAFVAGAPAVVLVTDRFHSCAAGRIPAQ